MTIITVLFVLFGLGFVAVGGIGAVRLPDFYTRSHAIGVVDTLGTLLILGGLAFHQGFSFSSVKILIILCFIYLANPTVTHVLVRAAVKSGLKPWTRDKTA